MTSVRDVIPPTLSLAQLSEIQECRQAIGDILRHLDTVQHKNFALLIQRLDRLLENLSFLHQHGPLWEGEETSSPYSGLHEIVDMINTVSHQEPDWMKRTGKILVIDSNPNTAESLERRLLKEGHTVLRATDKQQTSDIIQQHAVDVILIDQHNLKTELDQFLVKIKQEAESNYIPIIIIGTLNETDGLEKILETGFGDYLIKPINPVLLRARIRSALERKCAFIQHVEKQETLQKARQDLEIAIRSLSDGFAIFDQNNRLIMHNDRLVDFYSCLKNKRHKQQKTQLTFHEFLNTNLLTKIHDFGPKGLKEKEQTIWLQDKITRFMSPMGEWEETLVTGQVLSITTYRTPDGGGAFIAKDISEDKAKHNDLTFLAYHDALTGLANRRFFQQKLSQAITNISVSAKTLLAVLYLDLDGFKLVNDSYGHDVGDWLLTQVAARLRRCVRGDDMAARIGGDEFSIILHEVINQDQIYIVADRILKAVSDPYVQNGLLLQIGVSIGIACYSEGINDANSLLSNADSAMYAAKQGGKGQFRFFEKV